MALWLLVVGDSVHYGNGPWLPTSAANAPKSNCLVWPAEELVHVRECAGSEERTGRFHAHLSIDAAAPEVKRFWGAATFRQAIPCNKRKAAGRMPGRSSRTTALVDHGISELRCSWSASDQILAST